MPEMAIMSKERAERNILFHWDGVTAGGHQSVKRLFQEDKLRESDSLIHPA